MADFFYDLIIQILISIFVFGIPSVVLFYKKLNEFLSYKQKYEFVSNELRLVNNKFDKLKIEQEKLRKEYYATTAKNDLLFVKYLEEVRRLTAEFAILKRGKNNGDKNE